MSDSTLFVVRIWRRLSAFRASVRRVDGEEPRVFDSAAEVARYLEQASEAPEAPRAPANGTEERDD